MAPVGSSRCVGILSMLLVLWFALCTGKQGALQGLEEVLAGIRQGNRLADGGQHEQAVEMFERALDGEVEVPHRHVVLFNLGLSYFKLKRFHHALERGFLPTLKELERTRTSEDKQLLSQVLEKLGETTSLIGSSRSAGEYFSRAADLIDGTDDIETYERLVYNAGNAFINAGELQRAIIRFQQGLAVAQTSAKLNIALGVALALNGEHEHARKVLDLGRHALAQKRDVFDLKLYAGLMLEKAKSYGEAVKFLELCMESVVRLSRDNSLPPESSSVVYHLGRSYRKLREYDLERSLYEKAMELGIWANFHQRPGYLVEGLEAKAWWYDGGEECLDEHDPLRPIVEQLETNWGAIAKEFVNVSPAEAEHDHEGIAMDARKWTLIPLARNGQVIERNWHRFRVTSGIITEIFTNHIRGLPRGSVEFSVLEPGTTLEAHCGPSNHRLRVHVGLEVPREEEALGLIVGGEPIRHWSNGKVFIFDDSFEHFAYNHASSRRVVLMMDIWHPDLWSNATESIRRSISENVL